ncbi:MAG: YheU family protein [Gammaproteobacteria bacterium]|nr:YheU family protein [Gammaproteobacteria bacterium]
MSEPEDTDPIAIDTGDLSAAALRGVAESFVLREGTDYGEIELSFDEKVANLLQLLESGEARVVFDPGTETVTVVMVP